MTKEQHIRSIPREIQVAQWIGRTSADIRFQMENVLFENVVAFTPFSTKSSSWTPEQAAAIQHSLLLGQDLQRDFPQIAQLYDFGLSIPEIAKRLQLKKVYRKSENIIQVALYHALVGYDGATPFNIEPYDGLLSSTEYREAHERIKAETSRGTGEKLLSEGRGIFGLTEEQKSRNRTMGRKKAWSTLKEIFLNKTSDERKEAGKKSAENRGFSLWSREEFTYAQQLWHHPDYQWKKGGYEGSPDYANITKAINDKFHGGVEVRTIATVQSKLFRSRKKE